MSAAKQSLENHLLITSGVLAIALAATVNGSLFGFWPASLVYVAFTVVFVVSAYLEPLGLPERWGVPAMLLLLVLSLWSLLLHPSTLALILSVVLMASLPYHLPARYSWALLVLANLAYMLLFRYYWHSDTYLWSWLSLLALQGFAITSSLTRQREIEIQQVLVRQNNELMAARAALAQQSRSEERLRIAGDLHDTIGHQLTALRLQLEALSHQCPAALAEQVQTCQQLSADLLERIRAIVRQMSEEERGDLAAAVQQLAAATPGVDIEVTTPLPALPAELAQQLVFCFQEAIHNAIRHGGATRVEIACRDGSLAVTDNGRGLQTPAPSGFGLSNIRKRLAPFGGQVELGTASAGGCLLRLSLPALQGSVT